MFTAIAPHERFRLPVIIGALALISTLIVGGYIRQTLRDQQQALTATALRELARSEARKITRDYDRFLDSFNLTLASNDYDALWQHGEEATLAVVQVKRFLYFNRHLLRELRLQGANGQERIARITVNNYFEITPRQSPAATTQAELKATAGTTAVTAVLTPAAFVREQLSETALSHPDWWIMIADTSGRVAEARTGHQVESTVSLPAWFSEQLRADTAENFEGANTHAVTLGTRPGAFITHHTPLQIGPWNSQLLISANTQTVFALMARTTWLIGSLFAALLILLALLARWTFQRTVIEQRKVEAARRRLESIWQTFQNGALLVEPNTLRIVDANPEAHRLLTGESASPINQQLSRFLPSALCERAVGAPRLREESTLHSLAGADRYAIVHTVIIRLEDQPFILCALSDITAMKESEKLLLQTQQQLRVSLAAAEAATQAKSDFLANMSHEIRTPMNAVIGMTELLQSSPLTNEQAAYVGTIRTSGDALLTLINDILDFSKIESGHLELEQAPVNLRDCLESALAISAHSAAAKDLELMIEIEPGTPENLVGDVTRLRQVVTNLLSNAVKFTAQGEVVITLSALPSQRLRCSVRDTGVGIPAGKLDRLFKSFSQVDSSITRNFGGTGLGLAISQRLIGLMGGRIAVDSTPGQGSTFSFEIPFSAAPSPASPYLREHASLVGRRVLIVDDNATNRRILASQARSWRLEAQTAASGPEALAWLDQGERFDAALIDMQMPGMDGLALAAELRRRLPASQLPLLALTSLGTASAAFAGLDVAQVITKPARASILETALCALFQSKTAPVPREAAAASEAAANAKAEAGAGLKSSLSILLVEDIEINQQVATLLLGRLGYSAQIANNGVEALEAVARESFDLIFLDMQMPEMDGLTCACRLCAEHPPSIRPWITAMTANALEGDREKCLAAGMDDYVSKPISGQALSEAIERAVEGLRPRRGA